MVEIVYKFNEKSYRECLKGESIAIYNSNFLWSTNILYMYMETNSDHFIPLALCVRGNKKSICSSRTIPHGSGKVYRRYLPVIE